MADGSSWRTGAEAGAFGPGGPKLVAATAPRSSLWARCGCGREASVDPARWLGQGLGRNNIEDLEERLRCLCGARRAKLEIRGLAEAPGDGAGGIWVFR